MRVPMDLRLPADFSRRRHLYASGLVCFTVERRGLLTTPHVNCKDKAVLLEEENPDSNTSSSLRMGRKL